MKKIKMGVIGTGGISAVHIKGIIASPDAELTSICDINDEVLSNKANKYGIDAKSRYKDYEDLLKNSDVDAVSICTPNNSHFEIAKTAILHGKPFLLEKPITMNYKEALELEELAKKHKVPNMIAFSYRFKAAARYAKWLVENGYLGKIMHVYGQYFQSWAISERPEMRWRFKKSISGSGTLGDIGSHIIDVARFIVGEFESVCGDAGTFIEKRKYKNSEEYDNVDVDDYCHFLARMEDKVGAIFSATRYAYGRGNYQRLEIYGNKGALVYTLDEDGTAQDFLEVCIGDIYAKDRSYKRLQIPDEFKADQMQSFFDIINKVEDKNAATITDGKINQLILDSIIKSFETKNWIDIKEKKNG